jgi:hypothetical protein
MKPCRIREFNRYQLDLARYWKISEKRGKRLKEIVKERFSEDGGNIHQFTWNKKKICNTTNSIQMHVI